MSRSDESGIVAIGAVVGGRTDRRVDGWDREEAASELDERFEPAAIAGLDSFSHVEVVFRLLGRTMSPMTTADEGA